MGLKDVPAVGTIGRPSGLPTVKGPDGGAWATHTPADEVPTRTTPIKERSILIQDSTVAREWERQGLERRHDGRASKERARRGLTPVARPRALRPSPRRR